MNIRTIIDVEKWDRRDHYRHFSSVYRPALSNIVSELDVTHAYARSKEHCIPFFSYYLYLSLLTINSIRNFRYRQEGENVVHYAHVDAAYTVARNDHSFGFAKAEWADTFPAFAANVKAATERCKREQGLPRSESPSDVIHYTVLKDLYFTGLTFSASNQEDIPKFAFGKVISRNGRLIMPHALQVPHMFADGYHSTLYFNRFQEHLNSEFPLD